MRRDKGTTMTTKEEVKRIVDKYDESFSELSNNGTNRYEIHCRPSQQTPTTVSGLEEDEDEECED